MIRKLTILVFVAVLGTGCSGALKSGWDNFQAYYNTYYNAKEYFKDGERAVLDQPRTLDPESPVRVHPPPASAGREAFQQAIEKSGQILREHTESDWVDDALLLMGKSYYYLQDFAAAVKQFEQLEELVSDPSLKRQAMIWKGKALLDMETYQQGIAYLEEMVQNYPPEWPAEEKGELQVLAAEHHAMLGQWEEAAELLSAALSNVTDKSLQGPVYFLHGQMLERQDRLGEASYAYAQVPASFPGFEYIYWSRFKQADVARKRGDLESALDIYQQLRQNDKYVDQYDQLAFEVARTMEMQGKIKEAEEHYAELLYEESMPRTLQAEIHYRLGEIQSEWHQDYTTAAAHFDTSASLRNEVGSSSNEEAETLADAFGEYTELQQSIQHADSLLWLGSLPPAKLDSVLGQIRSERKNQLLEHQDDESENQLLNQPELSTDADTIAESSMYGFLNHRSQNLVEQGKTEFRIIWDGRPLVDNWRRQAAIRRAGNDRSDEMPEREELNDENAIATLNLDAIPRTASERAELKRERTRFWYQLGNVLFLNLDRPDSARVYYRKVLNRGDEPQLRLRAMYAIHETFRPTEHTDSLRYWRDRIIVEYPDSKYARLADPEQGNTVETESDSTEHLLEQYRAIEDAQDTRKATRLRALALANRESGLAPQIHFRAVEAYIQQARIHQDIADMLFANAMALQADSIEIFPEGANFLGYSVTQWDSVRSVLAEHQDTFEPSPHQLQVEYLREELKEPEILAAQGPPTCEEHGIRLAIEPDIQTFLAAVEWPESVRNGTLSGEVTYTFIINENTDVLSYKLESPRTSLGVEEALEAAFDEHLTFRPPDLDPPVSELQCRFSFPVK